MIGAWDSLLSLSLAQKYQFAVQWSVLCVNQQWLHRSIEKGYCQDEGEYLLGTVGKKPTSSGGTSVSTGSMDGRNNEDTQLSRKR